MLKRWTGVSRQCPRPQRSAFKHLELFVGYISTNFFPTQFQLSILLGIVSLDLSPPAILTIMRTVIQADENGAGKLQNTKAKLSRAFMDLIMYNRYINDADFVTVEEEISRLKTMSLAKEDGLIARFSLFRLLKSARRKHEKGRQDWIQTVDNINDSITLLSTGGRERYQLPLISAEVEAQRIEAILKRFAPFWDPPKPEMKKKESELSAREIGERKQHMEAFWSFYQTLESDPTILDDEDMLDHSQTYYMNSSLYPPFITIIREIAKETRLFPAVFHIDHLDYVPEMQTQPDGGPRPYGAQGVIYHGIYQGRVICLKKLKEYTADEQITPKKLAREVVPWGQVSHSNLLPFYGIYDHKGTICLVSPWARNGTLVEFLNLFMSLQKFPAFLRRKNQPSLSKTRLLLCSDVVAGLQHLHDWGIIHGDLKGDNIFIDGSYRAYIADFGYASVDPTNLEGYTQSKTTWEAGGTTGHTAPEIMVPHLFSEPAHKALGDRFVPFTKESEYEAYIADFELSSFHATDLASTETVLAGGTSAYVGPEILAPLASAHQVEDSTAHQVPEDRFTLPTKESDIFSFSVIFGGVVPIWPSKALESFKTPPEAQNQYYAGTSVLGTAIVNGLRPQLDWIDKYSSYPMPIDGDIWQLMKDCWEHHPNNRPKIEAVAKRLAQKFLTDDRSPGEWLNMMGDMAPIRQRGSKSKIWDMDPRKFRSLLDSFALLVADRRRRSRRQ
ncbi:hypothetical protein H0H92_003357 [Tricholoma furcatifolium]|nr:hypothetical protein H0H92_003357 [Tricholoma furcatifolium]